jgi:UDP-N-acetylmuramoyl-L-alanyl-D-glutamate--2,6-diaminopimelate ligase
VVLDRREAIDAAIEMAGSGDVVVVAGKGHERGQVLATVTHDFDDMEEARAAVLRKQGGAA